MKLLKNSITVFLLGLFVIGLTCDMQAQDRRSIVKSYNKGIELKKNSQFEQAINVFNQTIANAQEMEDGQDIVERCQQQLVDTNYKLAVSQYQQLKSNQNLENFDTAISAFRNAKDVAAQFDNTDRVNKINQLIPQLMYQKGVYAYKSGKKQASLDALNKAVEVNSNYANAYYQMAIVKKNMDGVGNNEVISSFQKALEIGQKTNNNSVITNSQEQLSGLYLTMGYALVEQEKGFEQAIEYYQQAQEYTPQSAQVYFRLAEAYNKIQEWQQAIDNARRGIEYESGGRNEKAKIYFELATAYQGLGQKENACSAFSNAAYGSFKSPAEHQMEYELKCESATSN